MVEPNDCRGAEEEEEEERGQRWEKDEEGPRMGFETRHCVSTEELIAGQAMSCEGWDIYIIMQMFWRMDGERK